MTIKAGKISRGENTSDDGLPISINSLRNLRDRIKTAVKIMPSKIHEGHLHKFLAE